MALKEHFASLTDSGLQYPSFWDLKWNYCCLKVRKTHLSVQIFSICFGKWFGGNLRCFANSSRLALICKNIDNSMFSTLIRDIFLVTLKSPTSESVDVSPDPC